MAASQNTVRNESAVAAISAIAMRGPANAPTVSSVCRRPNDAPRIATGVNSAINASRGAVVDEAARLLKLQLLYAPEVQQPQDIEPAFEAMKRAGAQAVYVIGGTVIYLQRQEVVELELRHRLPGMHFSFDYVRAGGLMSYGTDLGAQFRRSAWYVARILNGAIPDGGEAGKPAAQARLTNSLTMARSLNNSWISMYSEESEGSSASACSANCPARSLSPLAIRAAIR